MTMALTAASISDIGLSEKTVNNEDSFLMMKQEGVFAVADGVGGADRGDIASHTAMEAIREHTVQKSSDVNHLVEIGNSAIFKYGINHGLSMASTIDVLVIRDGVAQWAHIGDSRIYFYRDGELRLLTKDHTREQKLIDQGTYTHDSSSPEQRRDHHILTRSIGSFPSAEADMGEMPLKRGDIFLLSTDGIHNCNTYNDLAFNIKTNQDDLEKVCDTLKDICYQRGAPDNLTAVVVKVDSL